MRSLIHSPVAVIHSPAATVAAWPTTVTRSRCERAFVRNTQNPFSALWNVTRSTRPASTSPLDCSNPGVRADGVVALVMTAVFEPVVEDAKLEPQHPPDDRLDDRSHQCALADLSSTIPSCGSALPLWDTPASKDEDGGSAQ